MSDIAIRVENLSKRYRIGAKQEGYKRFTETMMDTFSAPIRRAKRAFQRHDAPTSQPYAALRAGCANDYIWALKDVSFEVKRGEAVGIIGRNGAGKSTLLKILSRITEPTEGAVDLYGRVGSLLEVGTGFHPELTGRENVYLNGVILGMRRQEVDRKFDEIVDFSGVEKFIDTPVKRYSSGMRVRLAFAVAAHLEPEILLIDEVLAVGDAQFQKKCLGKMGDVASEGRTVLFVSHNMDAIIRLCDSAICMESGRVSVQGPTALVVEHYISSSFSTDSSSVVQIDVDTTDRKLVFSQVSLIPDRDVRKQDDSVLNCYIEYQVLANLLGAVIAVRVDSISGMPVMTLTDNDLDEGRFVRKRGAYRAMCSLPINLLAPGIYRLTVSAADMKGTRYDYHEGILSFEVTRSRKIKPTFRREGPLLVPVKWQIQEIHDDSNQS